MKEILFSLLSLFPADNAINEVNTLEQLQFNQEIAIDGVNNGLNISTIGTKRKNGIRIGTKRKNGIRIGTKRKNGIRI